jgi:uncharacterized protein YebE (UPF0316 family)
MFVVKDMNMVSMEELIQNPWYSSILVFITQILMLFLRTINIVYTTKRYMFGALWSNTGVALTWLLSMSIGMNSVLSGQWQPIISFLLGGLVGTYWGICNENKKYDIKTHKSTIG